MAIIKCKMCGGDLALIEGQSVAECEYCGSRQTVPAADNERKLTLFARANRLRAACEFDKAAGIYETIVADFPKEAESYWGLVLCKYGIEYVDDPATGRKIPTCHRSSFDAVMDDSNFEQAMENADEVALRLYRQEAKQIERIRRGILEVSSSERPYDIFICYKETDSKGNRTVDSLLAQDIYEALIARGYRVFFSRITLEDKLGQAYEPYIFAALNSAKIMLAVGTCYENYHAVWVKNEWSRYIKIIANHKDKYLIPCYKGLDPAEDLPREFAHLQGQDMGKVGAIADLLRGIEKLLHQEQKAVAASEKILLQTTGNVTTGSLLKRAYIFLEDQTWNSANEYCEKVLDIDPENAEAYLGKLLAEFQIRKKEELGTCTADFTASNNYQKAQRYGDDNIQLILDGACKDQVYYAAKKQITGDPAGTKKSAYWDAATQLATIAGWRDADALVKHCHSRIAEIEAKEAALRQEKERMAAEQRKAAKKRAKKVKKIATILISLVCAMLALVILLNSVIIPSDQKVSSDTAVNLPALTEPPVQTEPTVQPELPVPGSQEVSFTTAGDITVHGLWDKQMADGQIRYTLDVTTPPGKTVTILDTVYENAYGTYFNVQPTNGKHIDIQLPDTTTKGRQTIVFDLDADKVVKADRLIIRFEYIYDHSNEANIYVKPNKYDVNSASVITEGAEESQNQIGFSTAGKITVHSFLEEKQSNGSIRYTLDFTAGAGREISMFDTPSGKVFKMTHPTKTVEGRQTITFDLQPWQVTRFTVSFKKPEDTTADLWIYARPKSSSNNDKTTSSKPSGSMRAVSHRIQGNVQVYTFWEQLQNNGKIRYDLEFTAPKGRYVVVFNPPTGNVFMLNLGTATGEKQHLTFEVDATKIASVNEMTVKIYDIAAEQDAAYIFSNPHHF